MKKLMTRFVGAFAALALLITAVPAAAIDCTTVTLQLGSQGECAQLVQSRLNVYYCEAGPHDGDFGPMTEGAVMRFQAANGMTEDGVVDGDVWPALDSLSANDCNTVTAACSATVLQAGSSGSCAKLLQKRLNIYECETGNPDGNFGSWTDAAVKRFQAANGLAQDGIVDGDVWPVIANNAANLCARNTADNDAEDRALCTFSTKGKRAPSNTKCILVHQIGGQNVVELYENNQLVDSVSVNTGIAGARTRNTTGNAIDSETFPTESSEMVTNDGFGVETKTWAPGVRQVYDDNAAGLLGDFTQFDGGIGFHWRVDYSTLIDENGKSIPVILNGLAQERNEYTGGYASGGCPHTPKWFMDLYDNSFFQVEVKVVVQDQPLY